MWGGSFFHLGGYILRYLGGGVGVASVARWAQRQRACNDGRQRRPVRDQLPSSLVGPYALARTRLGAVVAFLLMYSRPPPPERALREKLARYLMGSNSRSSASPLRGGATCQGNVSGHFYDRVA